MIYSSGVKINPILGRGFRTLERVVGFLTLARKTARKTVYFTQITWNLAQYMFGL